MPPARGRVPLAVLVALLTVGCADRDASRPAEVTLPVVWTLTAEPRVAIGDESGGPATFERIAGVHMDASGRIFVVDRGASQIRAFTAEGDHLATWGGKGEGPGEYGAPRLLGAMRGDTLVVVDDRNQLIVYLSDQGVVGRTLRFADPRVPTPRQALAVVADGRIVHQVVGVFGGMLEAGSVLSDTIHLRVTEPPKEGAEVLGPSAAPQWVWTGDDQVPMPFSPEFSVSARGDSVFTLNASGAHVVLLRGGLPPEPWGAPRMPTPVLRQDKDAYRADVGARGLPPQVAELWNGALDHPDLPRTKPVYDRVLAADDGEIWARVAGMGGGVDRWDVYSPRGAFRGVVDVPAGAALQQVTVDRVVTVVRDPMGVQTVAVFGKEAVRDPARVAAAVAEVRAELESLVDLQDIYFADHYAFTTYLQALHETPPVEFPDVSILVTSAGQEGWAARATHVALAPDEGCSVVRGRPPEPPEPTWSAPDGEIVCDVGGS